nr:PREDICTED: oxygen-regulated protein 1 [Latimeria chalumnae]|eukprot:XP_014342376.1 PREDICTED: oxygen-regulated protein 1 [Latimeria chalumnae]
MSSSASTNFSMNQLTESGRATRYRHPNITDPVVAKKVCFYKSGDPQFSGLKMVVSNRSFKTFDALLDNLSKKVPLPFGVRNITTPKGVHNITRLEELEDGKSYICSHQKKVKPVNLELASKKPIPWYSSRPISARRRIRQLVRNKKIRSIPNDDTVVRETPRKLVVFKNGDPGIKHTLILNKKLKQSFEVLLDHMSEVMQCPVIKLYTSDGRRVDDISQVLILNSGVAVAAGREPFKPGNYDSCAYSPSIKLPDITRRIHPKTISKTDQRNLTKMLLSSSRSQILSSSSDKYPVNEHSSVDSFSHLPDNHMNSIEKYTYTGEDIPFMPSDDDIEKSIHVNQDGSMTVEMKVRLRIKNEETLQWTTIVSRSSLSSIVRDVCNPAVSPNVQSPNLSHASFKDNLDGLYLEDCHHEDNDKLKNVRTKPDGEKNEMCITTTEYNHYDIWQNLSASKEVFNTMPEVREKQLHHRPPTPGPRKVKQKQTLFHSVTRLSETENVVGSYIKEAETRESEAEYCTVSHYKPKPLVGSNTLEPAEIINNDKEEASAKFDKEEEMRADGDIIQCDSNNADTKCPEMLQRGEILAANKLFKDRDRLKHLFLYGAKTDARPASAEGLACLPNLYEKTENKRPLSASVRKCESIMSKPSESVFSSLDLVSSSVCIENCDCKEKRTMPLSSMSIDKGDLTCIASSYTTKLLNNREQFVASVENHNIDFPNTSLSSHHSKKKSKSTVHATSKKKKKKKKNGTVSKKADQSHSKKETKRLKHSKSESFPNKICHEEEKNMQANKTENVTNCNNSYENPVTFLIGSGDEETQSTNSGNLPVPVNEVNVSQIPMTCQQNEMNASKTQNGIRLLNDAEQSSWASANSSLSTQADKESSDSHGGSCVLEQGSIFAKGLNFNTHENGSDNNLEEQKQDFSVSVLNAHDIRTSIRSNGALNTSFQTSPAKTTKSKQKRHLKKTTETTDVNNAPESQLLVQTKTSDSGDSLTLSTLSPTSENEKYNDYTAQCSLENYVQAWLRNILPNSTLSSNEVKQSDPAASLNREAEEQENDLHNVFCAEETKGNLSDNKSDLINRSNGYLDENSNLNKAATIKKTTIATEMEKEEKISEECSMSQNCFLAKVTNREQTGHMIKLKGMEQNTVTMQKLQHISEMIIPETKQKAEVAIQADIGEICELFPLTDSQTDYNIKLLHHQLQTIVKALKSKIHNKRLEKSLSVPELFSNHSFTTSCKVLLTWLAVTNLKENALDSQPKNDTVTNNCNCIEMLAFLQSLQQLTHIEQADDLKAVVSDLQELTSNHLLQIWKAQREGDSIGIPKNVSAIKIPSTAKNQEMTLTENAPSLQKINPEELLDTLKLVDKLSISGGELDDTESTTITEKQTSTDVMEYGSQAAGTGVKYTHEDTSQVADPQLPQIHHEVTDDLDQNQTRSTTSSSSKGNLLYPDSSNFENSSLIFQENHPIQKPKSFESISHTEIPEFSHQKNATTDDHLGFCEDTLSMPSDADINQSLCTEPKGHNVNELSKREEELTAEELSSYLTFCYDSNQNTEKDTNELRTKLCKEGTDVQGDGLVCGSASAEANQQSQNQVNSDWSDCRANSADSEVSDYKSQASCELTTESSEETTINQKPYNTGYVKRTIEQLYGKAEANFKHTAFRKTKDMPKITDKDHSKTSVKSQPPFEVPMPSSNEELSSYNANCSKNSNIGATDTLKTCKDSMHLETDDGMLIDKGRWLLKENHLIRQSPPEKLGMYGNLDTTSADTAFDNTSEDVPCSHFRNLNLQPPLAELSSSELEEMAGPRELRCNYFSMPHGSDSEPFHDVLLSNKNKNSLIHSGTAPSRREKDDDRLSVQTCTQATNVCAEINGNFPSITTVEFRIPDNKVHPIQQSSDNKTVAEQPSRDNQINRRPLEEQDSLDKLYVICGQHCPILTAIIIPLNEESRGFVYQTSSDLENQWLLYNPSKVTYTHFSTTSTNLIATEKTHMQVNKSFSDCMINEMNKKVYSKSLCKEIERIKLGLNEGRKYSHKKNYKMMHVQNEYIMNCSEEIFGKEHHYNSSTQNAKECSAYLTKGLLDSNITAVDENNNIVHCLQDRAVRNMHDTYLQVSNRKSTIHTGGLFHPFCINPATENNAIPYMNMVALNEAKEQSEEISEGGSTSSADEQGNLSNISSYKKVLLEDLKVERKGEMCKIFNRTGGKWKVCVLTSDIPSAATSAEIYLALYGDHGSSGSIFLCGNGDLFQPGHEDIFTVNAGNIGELCKIRIGHNNSGEHPKWHCEEVRLQNLFTRSVFYFSVHRWLARDEDDGEICRELPVFQPGYPVLPVTAYEVHTVTGDLWNAGTDADVYISVFGKNSDSGSRQLFKSKQLTKFLKGQTDCFQLEAVHLGNLYKVVIGHDGLGAGQTYLSALNVKLIAILFYFGTCEQVSPLYFSGNGWFLEKVVIKDPVRHIEYTFLCHRWLDQGEEDGKLVRELYITDNFTFPAKQELELKRKEIWVSERWKFYEGTILQFYCKLTEKFVCLQPDGTVDALGDKKDKYGLFEVAVRRGNIRVFNSLHIRHLALAVDKGQVTALDNVSGHCELQVFSQPNRSIILESVWLPGHTVTFNHQGKAADGTTGYSGVSRELIVHVKGIFRDGAIVLLNTSPIQALCISSDGLCRGTGSQSKEAYLRIHKISSGVCMFESVQNPNMFLMIEGNQCAASCTGDQYCYFKVEKNLENGSMSMDINLSTSTTTGKSHAELPHQNAVGGDPEMRKDLKSPAHSDDEWSVSVLTGSAGTKANVILWVYGDQGVAGPIILGKDNKDELFLPRQEDEFQVKIDYVGKIYKIRIGHDGTSDQPEWKLKEVILRKRKDEHVLRFHANRWLSRERGDGEIVCELPVEEEGKPIYPVVQYQVLVYTGQLEQAETESPVYICIYGERGDSGLRLLNKSAIPVSLQRGQASINAVTLTLGMSTSLQAAGNSKISVDKFGVEAVSLGRLQKVLLRCKASHKSQYWYCEKIIIKEPEDRSECIFNCERWLPYMSQGIIQSDIEIPLQEMPIFQSNTEEKINGGDWKITVVTGDNHSAGTEATVVVCAYGKKGASGPIVLGSGKHQLFNPNSADTFKVNLKDLGELYKIRIGHDNSGEDPGWYLEEVKLNELPSGQEITLPVFQWLAEDQEDGDTWKELPVVKAGNKPLPERTFSTLRRLKTCLRSMMNQDRLNNLLLLHVHKDWADKLDLKQIAMLVYEVHVYTGSKPRAEADSNVYINIFGTRGDSGKRKLHKSQNHSLMFQQGKTLFTYKVLLLAATLMQGLGQTSHTVDVDIKSKISKIVDTTKIGYTYRANNEGQYNQLQKDLELFSSSASNWQMGFHVDICAKRHQYCQESHQGSDHQGPETQTYIGPPIARSMMNDVAYKKKVIPCPYKGLSLLSNTKSEREQKRQTDSETAFTIHALLQLSLLYVDIFNIDAVSLGELKKVVIGHDGVGPGNGWFLDKIKIKYKENDEEKATMFPCSRWFDEYQDDGKTERELFPEIGEWRILVKTYKDSAVLTEPKINLMVYGSKGNSNDLLLSPKNQGHTSFLPGATDEFVVALGNVGDVYKIRVSCDDLPVFEGWHLKSIHMKELHSQQELNFDCNCWLSLSKEDSELVKEFPAVSEGQKSLPECLAAGYSRVWAIGSGACRVDSFIIEAVSLGQLKKVVVGHDGEGFGAGMYLKMVTVQKLQDSNTEWVFPCWRWLDDHIGNRQTACKLKLIGQRLVSHPKQHQASLQQSLGIWLMTISGSDMKKESEPVHLTVTVYGEKNHLKMAVQVLRNVTEIKVMHINTKTFCSYSIPRSHGMSGMFMSQNKLARVGPVSKVHVSSESDGLKQFWRLDSIHMRHTSSKQELWFNFNCWFKPNEGTCIELPALYPNQDPSPDYTVQVYTGDGRNGKGTGDYYLRIHGEKGDLKKSWLTKSSSGPTSLAEGQFLYN